MAQRVFIPIVDPNPECFQFYRVEYKTPTDLGYSTAPDSYSNPIIIDGLIAGVEYTFRITKICCDGVASNPTTITHTPTPSIYPTKIVLLHNSAAGPGDASFITDLRVDSPEQIFFSGPLPFIRGTPNTISLPPLDNSTAMPASTAYPILLNNDLSNATDYDYSISITDWNGDPIMDSSFPYTGTIVSGEALNIPPTITYGTTTNGYIITIEITDAT